MTRSNLNFIKAQRLLIGIGIVLLILQACIPAKSQMLPYTPKPLPIWDACDEVQKACDEMMNAANGAIAAQLKAYTALAQDNVNLERDLKKARQLNYELTHPDFFDDPRMMLMLGVVGGMVSMSIIMNKGAGK
jgi:hypothetical protein